MEQPRLSFATSTTRLAGHLKYVRVCATARGSVTSHAGQDPAGELQHGDSFMVHNEEWTAWVDARTARMYYHNTRTNATQWVDPRPKVCSIHNCAPAYT